MDKNPQSRPEPDLATPADLDEFQVESAADVAEAPVVYGAPVEVVPPQLDPESPVRWVEQEAPPYVEPLPVAGAIRIAWSVKVVASDGVIFEGDQDCVHKNMDSERMRSSVDAAILANLHSSLIDPLRAHIKAFGNERLNMSTLAAQAQEPLSDVRLNSLALPAAEMQIAFPAIAPAMANPKPPEAPQG